MNTQCFPPNAPCQSGRAIIGVKLCSLHSAIYNKFQVTYSQSIFFFSLHGVCLVLQKLHRVKMMRQGSLITKWFGHAQSPLRYQPQTFLAPIFRSSFPFSICFVHCPLKVKLTLKVCITRCCEVSLLLLRATILTRKRACKGIDAMQSCFHCQILTSKQI